MRDPIAICSAEVLADLIGGGQVCRITVGQMKGKLWSLSHDAVG